MFRAFTGLAVLLGATMTAGAEAPAELAAKETGSFSGIVLAVDVPGGLLTVEEASLEGAHQHFVLKEDTEITKDGKSLDLADVEVGDPVSIEYEKTSNGNEATSIAVITAPAT